jgi:Arm DNA-binding domain
MLEVPAPTRRRSCIYYDAGDERGADFVFGFGLRVTENGARAFILNYRNSQGVQRRLTIGRAPPWNVPLARAWAGELRRWIDMGRDPLAERRVARRRNHQARRGDIDDLRADRDSWRQQAQRLLTLLEARSA